MIEALNELAERLDSDTLRKASAICGVAERVRFTLEENKDMIEQLQALFRYDLNSLEAYVIEQAINTVSAADNFQDVYDLSESLYAVKSAPKPVLEL